jgi:hypothetical protein
MKHLWLGVFAAVMLLPATALRAQDNQDEKTDPPAAKADSGDEASVTPAEQYKALVAEYQSAYQKWLSEAQAASREGKAVDMTSRPNPQTFAAKFMALADKNPDEPVAADALFWIASNVRRGPEAEKAIAALFEKHPESEHIGPACALLSSNPSKATEDTLQKVMKTHPDTDVQGQACYALAGMYKSLLSLLPMLEDEQRAKQIASFYGDDFITFVKSRDVDKTNADVEQLFETISAKYANVNSRRGLLGELAKRELFEIRNLSVGCDVPDIVAEDIDGTEFKLSDYRGKVVLLDFWGDW